MADRYSMRACVNGHVDTPQLEISPSEAGFCEYCGAKIIDRCPSCGARIPGSYVGVTVLSLDGPMRPPKFCNSCGKPYPWTTRLEMLGKISESVENSPIEKREKLEIKEALSKLADNKLPEEEQVGLARKIKAHSKQLGGKAYSEAKEILTEAMARAAAIILTGK